MTATTGSAAAAPHAPATSDGEDAAPPARPPPSPSRVRLEELARARASPPSGSSTLEVCPARGITTSARARDGARHALGARHRDGAIFVAVQHQRRRA